MLIVILHHWKLNEIETPEGSRSPAVLHSLEGESRVVLIGLEPGQELGEHQVKENAWIIVLDEGLSTPYEGEPTPLFQIGVHHFGFWVDNLDAIADRARAAGVTIVTEPSQAGVDTPAYGEPSGGRVRSMFVRDPDGNTVQFDQRVS